MTPSWAIPATMLSMVVPASITFHMREVQRESPLTWARRLRRTRLELGQIRSWALRISLAAASTIRLPGVLETTPLKEGLGMTVLTGVRVSTPPHTLDQLPG